MKLIKQGGWIVRKHPAADDSGKSVYLPEDILQQKRRDMGPYVYACQMMLNPSTKENQRFRPEWLKFYRNVPKNLNLFLMCDPANSKKYKNSGSDYTVYWLWGIDSDGNKFLVDMVRDRLTLTERWTYLRDMVRKYRGKGIQRIGYEQYGMAADIQHFEEMMDIEGIFFSIVELKGNKLSKEDRIARLIPAFEQGKIWLPEFLYYTDKNGNELDLVKTFVDDEYLTFPFCQHDDMLDAASRIEDEIVGAFQPYDEMEDLADSYYGQREYQPEPIGRSAVTGY
jgi:predicted phage terminase large subunit-like protein